MISVIIPTYNRASLIGYTLDSLINQSYTDWECIIIDDNSTDNTEEIVAIYLEKDKRFNFFSKPKHLSKGPSASRNYGLKKAKGDYINWLDSDDLIHPEKMTIDLKTITSGDYDFTICQSQFFTDDDSKPTKDLWNKNLWSDDPINDFIVKKIGWSINAPLWDKRAIDKICLSFDEDLITADDFFYHSMAIISSLRPYINHETLTQLRQHPDRLNDFKKKSPFKLKVFLQLLGHEFSSNLNQDTIDHLNKALLRQYSNLLKNKDVELAKHYRGILIRALPSTHETEINRLYFYGILYKWTKRFYSKLTPIINIH